MKLILFVNDSLFSYLLAKPVIERHHNDITAVVFSNRTTGSIKKILDVYRKTHLRYFVYRSFIGISARIGHMSKRRTVQTLAEKYRLKTYRADNVNTDPRLAALLPIDVGITFNFDQILKKPLLTKFIEGVFNVHASHLPHDKGISPVLWAFARGDASIWSTLYKMAEGIDTGIIFRQIETPVRADESAYALYARVCQQSGEALVELLDDVIDGKAVPIGISSGEDGNYLGWPDKHHAASMKKNHKKFMAFSEGFRTLCS